MFNKNLRKGTVWTIIFFLASFAKTIILTPLMLLHWGTEAFSNWAIIISARAIILFLSDGFVRYIVNEYNLLFHTDEPKANTVLGSGVSFLCVFSIFICGIIGLVFSFVPAISVFVFDIKIDRLGYLPFCLTAYILAASVQTIQRMYAGTKEVRGLVWQNLLVEVLLVAVEIIILAALLFSNFNFSSVVFADSGLVFLTAAFYLFYLAKKYPLPEVLKLNAIKSGARYFSKATQLYAGNFFEKLSTDGLVLLLSFFRFDKAVIALFATVRTIVNTPLLAQNLLLNTYTPALQKDFALRNTEALKKLFTTIRVRVGLILLVGIVCCYPLYEPLFLYWTKNKIDYNESFMVSMLVMTVFNLYGLSFAFILKGLNVLPQMLGLMLFKSILIITGFYFAQQHIEMIGWLLAAAEIICSVILLPILVNRFWQKQKMTFSLLDNLLALIPYLLTAACLFLFKFLSG